MPWPSTDCIIGNPPFLGASHIRAARGDAYIKRLKALFNVGVKDYCVYWFRKADDHLKADQRAGLVGTNSISQNLDDPPASTTSSAMAASSPTQSPRRSG